MHMSDVVLSSMQTSFLCLSLLVEVSIWQVSAAPGCDLKAIFQTPRRDFDELELVERSNFDSEPKRCRCGRRRHLDEDSLPVPYANAQVLLRIGCDKDDTDNGNNKENMEPCNNVPKGTGGGNIAMVKDTASYYQPVQYQQNFNPCPTHVPYVFPNYLYYDPVGSMCSHLLPIIQQILLKKRLTSAVKEALEDEEIGQQFGSPTSTDSNNNIIFKNTPEDVLKMKEESQDANIQNPSNDNPQLEEILENFDEKSSKTKHKKASEKDLDKEKEDFTKNGKGNNIQKIAPPLPDGNIDYSPIIEENGDGKFISLNAIKVEDPVANAEKDEKNSTEDSLPAIESRNCNVTLHLLKIDPTKLNGTNNSSSSADLLKLLNEALIPIACLGCDKVKKLVSYPIVNRKPEDDSTEDDVNFNNCGCKNHSEHDEPKIQTSRFSADIDDLNLMNGEPITQSSIISNFAPKFYNNLMAAKSLSRFMPLLQDPRVTLVKYRQNYEVPQQILEVPQNILEEPHKCTCKNCQCHLKRALIFEKPTVLVEPDYRKEVRILPSYLSRHFEKPLHIYEHAYQEIQEPSDEILVPVAILPEEESSNRCSCCAPYVGELNE